MVMWPDSLPQSFDARGYSDEFPYQAIGSVDEVDEKVRQDPRRGDDSPISGTMTMLTEEWFLLQAFFINDLADGVLSFLFPDIDNEGQYVHVAFTQPPQFTTIGGDLHRVQLSFQKQA